MNLHRTRNTIPGPWAPTRAELVEISIALADASTYSRGRGLTATGASQWALRERIEAILADDLLEQAYARDVLGDVETVDVPLNEDGFEAKWSRDLREALD